MLFGEVECDELYLVAGHKKGQPEKVRDRCQGNCRFLN